MPQSTNNNKSNKQLLMQYAGFGMQILVALGIAIWVGMKLDELLKPPFPILIWLLPVIVFIILIIKVVKDTSARK